MDIATFNQFFHQPTLHPLVATGDLARADVSLFEERDFGMYCVILMDSVFGELRKNDRELPYQAGSLFSLIPGQRVSLKVDYTAKRRGWMLAFRPELLVKSGLGRDFYMFDFFQHDFEAALALDERERGILAGCYENAFSELLQEPDYLTNHMIRLCIGRLLSYCKRFFEQRYAIRSTPGRNLARSLDTMIDSYLSSGSAAQQGQPNVSWCADQFHLTPNYFGSLVKRELHMSAQEFIQGKLISAAEKLLATTSMSVGEIAEELGFSYPNHFTRLFTAKTGQSPLQYRKKQGANPRTD
ncbi:MAG: helix-turn-helix transcriptional regulator [Bacteroidales bacterium]|nr:helix-turn-helix transcriptional regulator [Bacteroidales bacterium]